MSTEALVKAVTAFRRHVEDWGGIRPDIREHFTAMWAALDALKERPRCPACEQETCGCARTERYRSPGLARAEADAAALPHACDDDACPRCYVREAAARASAEMKAWTCDSFYPYDTAGLCRTCHQSSEAHDLAPAAPTQPIHLTLPALGAICGAGLEEPVTYDASRVTCAACLGRLKPVEESTPSDGFDLDAYMTEYLGLPSRPAAERAFDAPLVAPPSSDEQRALAHASIDSGHLPHTMGTARAVWSVAFPLVLKRVADWLSAMGKSRDEFASGFGESSHAFARLMLYFASSVPRYRSDVITGTATGVSYVREPGPTAHCRPGFCRYGDPDCFAAKMVDDGKPLTEREAEWKAARGRMENLLLAARAHARRWKALARELRERIGIVDRLDLRVTRMMLTTAQDELAEMRAFLDRQSVAMAEVQAERDRLRAALADIAEGEHPDEASERARAALEAK